MNPAYLAGLMDGEGCIGFTQIRGRIIPRVTITNTNLQLLEELKDKYGGHISKLSLRKENWKQGYSWVLQNTKAVEFIERIAKWLRIKNQQAWLLSLWNDVRPGYGHKYTEEIRDAIVMLKEMSNWLNCKGNKRSEISPIDKVLLEMEAA